MRIKIPRRGDKIKASDLEEKPIKEEMKNYEGEKQQEIYDEFRKVLSKLPAIGGTILNVLAEKGVNIPKVFIQTLSSIIREELRSFLNSIDVVGLAKKVLLDTAVELRIEVAFKDKSQESKIEKKILKREIKIKKKK